MKNRKRTLNQALQILTAAALAVVILVIWNGNRPSHKRERHRKIR